MDADRSDPPAAKPGCVVQLAEHRTGWTISLVADGAPAIFYSDHRDKQTALAIAIAVAVAMRGDLMILTNDHGMVLLPAEQLATDDRLDGP